jgi:hypothetical protein
MDSAVRSSKQEIKMQINNDTTTHQVAELMGSEADEIDGRIMMGLLSRECCVDTDELTDAKWQALLAESQEIRRAQYEH